MALKYGTTPVKNVVLTGSFAKTVSGEDTLSLPSAKADSLSSVTVSGSIKRSLLPDGYTQYDYITVNGDCYYITDYYPTNLTEIKTKTFVYKQPTSPIVCRWSGGPTNDTFGFYMGNVSGRMTFFYGRYSDSKYLNIESVTLNIEHDIYMGVNSITFDGTSYSITRGTFTSTEPLYIGAFNQTGTSLAGMMYGRIYPIEFIEGGKTVRHYIPCKNNNGVIGLYEAITGTFISSTGTGTAKKGRPYINFDTIPDTYTRIEFLQSTGTQYIDSGVIANFANNKIEQTAVVQYTTSNTDRELMGTNGYGFWGKNASNKIEAALGSVTLTDNALVKNVINWTTDPDGNKLILNVNSNQYTSTASTFVDASYAYYVFALGIRIGSGAAASFLCHAKVYEYMVAVDNEVVCHLIPVKRNSDSVLGMYDVVTGTFKTNAGTGTFTAGGIQATPSPTNPLPIVCNNGQLKLGSHGKNLFNKDSSPYLAGAYISSATVSQSTFYTTSNANYNVYRIEIKPNTTYTFGLIKANDPRWVVTNGNVILDTGNNGGGTAGTYKTITTGATAKYLFLSVAISGSYKCNDILQVEEGSEHTEYEAFHYVLVAEGVTETITDSDSNTATAEMLLSIGDYTDTQEILSGAVTRKVGVKVLDGTENWAKGTSFYADMPFNALQSEHSCICNYYVGKSTDAYTGDSDTVQVGYSVGSLTYWNRIYITANRTAYATANDFKTFLAQQYANGTPVIVVYPLATEITETVTGQTLNTIAGNNTLTITKASIENLPIEAQYTMTSSEVNYLVKDTTLVWANPKIYLEGPGTYTTVGSPTITNGVASDFSLTDYILVGTPFAPTYAAWEINICLDLSYPGSRKNVALINSTLSDFVFPKIAVQTESSTTLGIQACLSSNGSSWNINSSAVIVPYDYSKNSHVNLKYVPTTSTTGNYILSFKQEGQEFTTLATYSNKSYIFQNPNDTGFSIGADVGAPANWRSAFIGSIYLNNTYIRVNNQVWFGKLHATQDIAPVPADYPLTVKGPIGYTVVGSPTITDGVASGFSESNYLKIQNSFDLSKDIELVIEFTTPSSFGSTETIFVDDSCLSLELKANGSINSWNYTNRTELVLAQLEVSTTYKVKITVSSGTKTYYLMQNGVYTKIGEMIDANISSSSIYFGFHPNVSGRAFSGGSINLNNTYITVNGQPWFGKVYPVPSIGYVDMRTQVFTAATNGTVLGRDD